MEVAAAVFGFIGVIFGSISTAILTIYKERVTGRREIETREQQYERERRTAREVFQRDSILALQTAITSLIGTAYDQLDRLLAEYHEAGVWRARTWETPTAKDWSADLLSLEAARARVFDDELRMLAEELRDAAGRSVWAASRESAEESSKPLEALNRAFNDRVHRCLPSLY